MWLCFISEIGSHVKQPRSIKIEKMNEILQNLEVISPIFNEGSIIGFIDCIEGNICTYKHIEENPIDSIRTYTTLLGIVLFLLGTSELLNLDSPKRMRCSNKSYWFHSCQYIGIQSLETSRWAKLYFDSEGALIQRPGQIIRHYGKHFHCVITAIDPILNLTGLSLSIGRRNSRFDKKIFWFHFYFLATTQHS